MMGRGIDLENELTVTSCRVMVVREFEIDMSTLLNLKWITKKDLLYSSGNAAQYYAQPGGKRSLEENGYMYMYG